MALVAALTVALVITGLSYYSRTAHMIGFRFLVVPVLLFAVLIVLAAVALCDASARYWAWPALAIETLFLLLVLGFNWYERGVEGPTP